MRKVFYSVLVSLLLFAALASQASITVTSPNGGENLLGCTVQEITWTTTSSSSFNLYYTTDGGKVWKQLAKSVGYPYKFTWTVPQLSSSACRIKVEDYWSPTTIFDLSDAPFSITSTTSSSLQLISPVGGEKWGTASEKLIRWNKTGNVSKVRIKLSQDNGSSWTTLDTMAENTGSYRWITPGYAYTYPYLVRISDYANDCIFDESDSAFAIVDEPNITITSPNGGESIFTSSIQRINWVRSNTNPSLVTIDFSLDSGKTWKKISTEANYSFFDWIVPNTPSSKCLIRVSGYPDGKVSDISNGVFSIVNPSVNILKPAVAASLTGCSKQTIQWTSTGTSPYVNINYSLDNGVTWNSAASSLLNFAGNNTFEWTVPDVNSDKCIVKISDFYTPSVSSTSGVFKIAKSSARTINVLYPNGGDSLKTGARVNLSWTSTGLSDKVAISYSDDGGLTWSAATTTANTGNFPWTVPVSVSSKYLIKITDAVNECTSDMSNAVFNVAAAPYITITFPNTAKDTVYPAGTYITWTSGNYSGSHVELFYSIDGGTKWDTISTYITSSGYGWVPPRKYSTKCLIKAVAHQWNSVITSDVSDDFFTINKPVVSITYPNGGETISGCASSQITWNNKGGSSYVNLWYSPDNGATWNQINSSSVTNKTGVNTFQWTPPGLPTENYLIKITDYYDNTLSFDVTDNTFSIANSGASNITITRPKGGETFGTYQNETITWTTTAGITNVGIRYSTNGGGTWNTIHSYAPNTGSYRWLVPNTVSSKYLINIVNTANNCVTDFSDKPFSVVAAPAVVMSSFSTTGSPVSLNTGNTTYLSWYGTMLDTSHVKLEYSADSGKTWKVIVADIKSSYSYSWKVPAENSTKCFVKVSLLSNPSVYDISDVPFTISTPVLKLLSPVGGETLTGCSVYRIKWQGQPLNSYVKILYSIDGGQNWGLVNSSVYSGATESFYDWTVPGIASSSYRIKISDAYGDFPKDSSAGNFTVDYSGNTFNITSPTDKDLLNTGSNTKITWTNTGTNGSNVDLKYTTDGTNWLSIATSAPNTGSYDWAIPAVATTKLKLQITDISKTCVTDFTDKNITIKSVPYVNVNWDAPSNSVKWTTNIWDFFTSLTIEFSSDSMKTWNTIGTNATNYGYFTYTPPNINSSKCFFRVSNAANSSQYGINASPVTISNYFAFTSPAAGEIVKACTTKAITWTSRVYSQVNLQFSSDNGVTWRDITTSAVSYNGTNSYSYWYPTGINSTKCLLKIVYKDKPEIFATSSVFTVQHTGPTLKITKPNGGESFGTGTQQVVNFTTTGSVPNVALTYSNDNGKNWYSIDSWMVPNTGTYKWPVPGIASTDYLVRVSDNTGCITDESDAKFTVVETPAVTLSSPAGGEKTYGFETRFIEWKAGKLGSEYVAVDYSLDSGKTWQVMSAKEHMYGSYLWKYPNVATTKGLIRVSDFTNPAVFDVSDSVFTIIKRSTELTSHTKGETITGCSVQKITWTSTLSSSFDLFYSSDNGTTWKTITTGVYTNSTTGSFDWSVPSGISGKCLIKVADRNIAELVDVSDVPFTIIAPTAATLNLISPNGGEVYKAGNDKMIAWSNTGTIATVALKYSTDGGTSWTAITSPANTGSYYWRLPATGSDKYLVAVSDASNACVSDQSDAQFSVQSIPTITVTSPKTKDTLYSYTNYNVSITRSADVTNNYYIELSTDSLRSWKRISSAYFDYYNNFVAPEVNSDNCFIRVSFGNYYGISTRFSIRKPTIKITAPVGGESLSGCNYQDIRWISKGTNGNVDLYFSTDNGVSWKEIATNIYNTSGSGYYSWRIPYAISKNCRIKIVNTTCNLSVVNAAPFTVSNGLKTLEILSPNGGESIGTGASKSILWESAGGITKVDLKYSADGGTNWENIAYNINNSGSYTWTAPPTASANALIRVYDNQNPCVFDQSNFSFSVDPSLTLLSPNGGEKLKGCTNAVLSWSSLGVTSYVTLQYSTDGGKFWNNIASTSSVAGINSYTWNVAGINTSKALVRISDAWYNKVSDVSNAVFSIENTGTSAITITSPNGKESWGTGSQKLITWNNLNVSNKATIEYSSDAGLSWYTLADAIVNTGSYNWRVPGEVSSNALIRVKDYNNSCISDKSDSVFSVIPASYITINSFNTYEKIYAGKYKTFYWSSGSLKSIELMMYYSVDSMKTWKILTGGYGYNGQFDWYVPAESSDKCFIKIFDKGDPGTFDINDAPFSIAKPNITLTAPNGGENWAACSAQEIRWTSEQASGKVNISYSTDNGLSWSPIASNVSNYTYNSYTWTVPTTIVGQHKIKVVDASNSSLTDASDTYFTLSNNPATVTLTSPNGGESLKGNSPINITWTTTGTVNFVSLSYSSDNGVSWVKITDKYSNTGSYLWTMPNNITSTQFLLKIADNGGCATDQSNAVFSVQKVPVLQIYSPNGGEVLGIGSATWITWHSENIPSGFVNIDYTTDNGMTWKNIVTQYFANSNNEYSWNIPNAQSGMCRVRVSDFSNPALNVMSSGTFTIAPPGITLHSPNGGEVLSGCSNTYINFTAIAANVVNIYFSADNGSNWSKISTVDIRQGSGSYYNWLVPSINSDKCLIKVVNYADTTMYDISNSVFSIKNNYIPTLKVTSPNGGENWASGSVQNITWTSDATVKSVEIMYSFDNGISWNTISKGTTNTGTYAWTIPTVASSKILVSITDIDNRCNTDRSNATFNITGTASLTLIYPNGGEKLSAGSAVNVAWNAALLTGKVKLEYSANAGTTWSLISDTAKNTGSYIWNTPSVNSTNVLIKVSDAGNAAISDVSNNVFSIENPKLRLTRPNGGEAWYGNTYKSIFWSASNIGSSYVKLEYSLDSAKTWKPIADKEANDGIYSWYLPNSGSVNCYVKISDYNNPAVYDVNDTVFTMIKPAFTILTPNGGETLNACTMTTVTWSGSASGNLFYSLDGGTTWTPHPGGLVANYSSSWKVPETSSTKCLFKIVDPNNSSLFDVSDAPFTISNVKPALTLTSPNGGEILGTGKKQTITWTAAQEVKFVKLEVAMSNSNYSEILYQQQIPNTGSADWTVYNTPGTAYIRISDRNSCATDVSNAAFTIKAVPFISVTAPDDVHQWTAGTTQEISWSSGNLSSGKVTIHYSVDGGLNWKLVATDIIGNSYQWKVPYTYTDNCFVKVSDVTDATVNGICNHSFKIVKPTFSYISIAHGKELNACQKTSLYWSTKSQSVNVYYSTDSGTTWKSIAKNVYSAPMDWTVPQENSAKCFIKVADSGDESVYGIGDFMFSINNPIRSVKLTNSFDNITTGSLRTITWTSTGSFYDANLEYSTDGGTNWNQIYIDYGYWMNGSYKWRIPNEPSINALFRISDRSSCAQDVSEPFKIEAVPYIYVTNPKGGENWSAGNTGYIYWSTGNLANPAVNLHYSADSGKTWVNIGTTSGTGYGWTIPYVSSDKALVKVSAVSNAAVYGINENVFTLSKPTITITYPNGGEKLTACTNNTITWKSNGVSLVFLYYSTDNGITWTRINQYSSSDRNYLSWMLPELSSAKVLIKAVDASDPQVSDVSDTVFTVQNINTTATLKLLEPESNAVWDTYSVHEIKWTSTGNIKYVNLMYSTYGGLTWENIATVPNTGSYKWQVPNTPTLSGVIKVADAASCVNDVNDELFAIKTVPYIFITYPAGGENLSQSSAVNINGTAANLSSDYVRLEYSADGGKTWNFITDNSTRSYSTFWYTWTVPAVISDQCLLKASDPLDPQVFTISKLFSISPATSVWPGDADNNGVADVYDMLPIGLSYGNSGLARSRVTTEWAAQNSLNWNRPQSNGLDMKFSDCDGDGIIYYQDTLAITRNYGLMHINKAEPQILAAADANLYFVIPEPAAPGETLHAEIWTGTSTDQVDNLYGIAFNIAFNANAVVDKSAELTFTGNWMGSQTMSLHKEFETLGRADGVLVCMDKTNKSGFGKIADFRVKLKNEASGLNLSFSNYRAVTADGLPVILAPEEEYVMLTPTGIEDAQVFTADVYPNPSTGQVFVTSGFAGKVTVTVSNALGETFWKGVSETGTTELALNELPDGAYYVKIEHEKGTVVKKLILQ